MEPTGLLRPRVSRETRLLLATVLISLAALWVLARMRFPDRPVTANPVPPLLTQLEPQPVFDDLASEVFQLEPKIVPALVALGVQRAGPGGGFVPDVVPALRFQTELAVAFLGTAPYSTIDGASFIGRDAGSGLAVVNVPPSGAPPPLVWLPQRLRYPRYMIATAVSPAGVSLRPVFIGPLLATDSPVWSAPVWAIPPEVVLPAGTFIFTTSGAIVGLVFEEAHGTVIVPADTVLAAAERLLTVEQKEGGTLGVDVQALTPAIGAAAAVAAGVVVTWVDPQGPAAGKLAPTDIVEALGGDAMSTPAHWRARVSRITSEETITIRIRRGGETVEVELVAAAAAAAAPADRPTLGLTLRARAPLGAEITGVEQGSIAARTGLQVGDLITRIGEVAAPTPAAVNGAFAALPDEGAVLAAVTRGDRHLVVALVKP